MSYLLSDSERNTIKIQPLKYYSNEILIKISGFFLSLLQYRYEFQLSGRLLRHIITNVTPIILFLTFYIPGYPLEVLCRLSRPISRPWVSSETFPGRVLPRYFLLPTPRLSNEHVYNSVRFPDFLILKFGSPRSTFAE